MSAVFAISENSIEFKKDILRRYRVLAAIFSVLSQSTAHWNKLENCK